MIVLLSFGAFLSITASVPGSLIGPLWIVGATSCARSVIIMAFSVESQDLLENGIDSRGCTSQSIHYPRDIGMSSN